MITLVWLVPLPNSVSLYACVSVGDAYVMHAPALSHSSHALNAVVSGAFVCFVCFVCVCVREFAASRACGFDTSEYSHTSQSSKALRVTRSACSAAGATPPQVRARAFARCMSHLAAARPSPVFCVTHERGGGGACEREQSSFEACFKAAQRDD